MENVTKAQKLLEGSCRHPEAERTELSNRKGFHCESCGANVHDKTQLSCVSSDQEPTQSRYKAVQAGTKWTVFDDQLGRQHGEKLYTQPKAKALADELNGLGVNSIGLNEEQKERSRKDKERLAKQQRKDELKALADDAKELAKQINEARKTYLEIQSASVTFKGQIEKVRPLAERVLYGFKHLKDGENIDGYTTATEWAKGTLGISYEWLRRCLNPETEIKQVSVKEGKLDRFLPAATEPAGATVTVHPEQPPLPIIPKQDEEGVLDGEYEDASPEATVEQPQEKPTVAESLADTRPSFAIAISPADVAKNGAEANARVILGYVRSYAKHITLDEYQETVRLVIKGLQYELDDEEGAQLVQVRMTINPTTEGESAVA